MGAPFDLIASLHKVQQIKRLVRDHAVLTCVYPQLFAIQLLAENAGMESEQPRLFTASFKEAKALLQKHPIPFLVVTTEQLADGSGLDLIRHVKAQAQNHCCLMLLAHNHHLSIPQTVALGADALVLEESISQQSGALLGALKAITQQQTYLDPALEAWDPSCDSTLEIAALSERQQEILQLVADGLGNREIAERLHLAPSTARDHVQAILRRLGVKSRAAAAVAGVRMGLVR